MAEDQNHFIVLDGDGNAVKIKADRFFVDQGMVFFQARDTTGGLDEVAVFPLSSHVVFNEANVVQ